MAIEIVDFPIKNGGSFNSYVKLPEGKPPFSYGFPMVFLWFSYGFVPLTAKNRHHHFAPRGRPRERPWTSTGSCDIVRAKRKRRWALEVVEAITIGIYLGLSENVGLIFPIIG